MSDHASTPAQPPAQGAAAAAPWTSADSIGHATWARLVEPGLAISGSARSGSMAISDATGIHDRQMSFLSGLSVSGAGLPGSGSRGWADDTRVFRMAHRRAMGFARTVRTVGHEADRSPAFAPVAMVHEMAPDAEPAQAAAIDARGVSASPAGGGVVARAVEPKDAAPFVDRVVTADTPLGGSVSADLAPPSAPAFGAAGPSAVPRQGTQATSMPSAESTGIVWRTPIVADALAAADVVRVSSEPATAGSAWSATTGDARQPAAAAPLAHPLALPALQRPIDAAPALALSAAAMHVSSASSDPSRALRAAAVEFVDIATLPAVADRSAAAGATLLPGAGLPRIAAVAAASTSSSPAARPLARSVAARTSAATAVPAAPPAASPAVSPAAASAVSPAEVPTMLAAGLPAVWPADAAADSPRVMADAPTRVVVTPVLASAQPAPAFVSARAQRAGLGVSAPAQTQTLSPSTDSAAAIAANRTPAPYDPLAVQREVADLDPDPAAAAAPVVVAVPAGSSPAAPSMPLAVNAALVQAAGAAPMSAAAAAVVPHNAPPAAPGYVDRASQERMVDREATTATAQQQPAIEALESAPAPTPTPTPVAAVVGNVADAAPPMHQPIVTGIVTPIAPSTADRASPGAIHAAPARDDTPFRDAERSSHPLASPAASAPKSAGELLLARSRMGHASSAAHPAFSSSQPIVVAGVMASPVASRVALAPAGAQADGRVFRDDHRSVTARSASLAADATAAAAGAVMRAVPSTSESSAAAGATGALPLQARNTGTPSAAPQQPVVRPDEIVWQASDVSAHPAGAAGMASTAGAALPLSSVGIAAAIQRAATMASPWVSRAPDPGLVFLERSPWPARNASATVPATHGPFSFPSSQPGAWSGTTSPAAADAAAVGVAMPVYRVEAGTSSHGAESPPDGESVSSLPAADAPAMSMVRGFPLAPLAARRGAANTVLRHAAFGGVREFAMPLAIASTTAATTTTANTAANTAATAATRNATPTGDTASATASRNLASVVARAAIGSPQAPYELAASTPASPETAATATAPSNQRDQPSGAAGPAAAGVDMDELVDRAWRAVMSRLAIERERRGYGRWA